MTTPMPDIHLMPENGHPFVSEDAYNELVYGILNADERLNVLEVMYSGGGIPFGSAVMWYGIAASIPAGWVICDGLNGTLDLRNLFILGAETDDEVGETGGAESHVHEGGAVASAGAHPHTMSSKTTGGVTGTAGVTGSGLSMGPSSHTHSDTPTISSAGAHVHTAGQTGATSNYPPYKCVYWITRLP